MMYAVYDESGRITQGNQHYHDDLAKVETIMRDLGQVWVKEDRRLVSPDEWYVAGGVLTDRPTMAITQSAKTIQAGSNEGVVFRGIPKGARCNISSGGYGLHDMTMDADELEFSIPVPCIYRVKFSLWPRRDAIFEVEAAAE